ncbi:MAG: hypothetical protein IH595_10670 [Bacteroidales bacterium]|nr:hypothetical protein [Bacteroidales bacterium]
MKSSIATERFYSGEIISQEDRNNLYQNLSRLTGMESVHLGLDFVEVDFDTKDQSYDSIQQELMNLSFNFKDIPKMGKGGFLSKLIPKKSGKSSPFSKSKGSCCD